MYFNYRSLVIGSCSDPDSDLNFWEKTGSGAEFNMFGMMYIELCKSMVETGPEPGSDWSQNFGGEPDS